MTLADRTSADHPGTGDQATLDQVRHVARTLHALRDAIDIDITLHAPFLDSTVVETCLSLPAHRRWDPFIAKPLLRNALAGLVPIEILDRRTKGDYTQPAYAGLRRASNTLRKLFESPATADYGLIEPAPVRETLGNALQGMPAPWGAINQLIAIELWLRTLDSPEPQESINA
jgi:asparagine synthase (glutamine-hydrolysing)